MLYSSPMLISALLGLAASANAIGGTWENATSLMGAPRQWHGAAQRASADLVVVGGIIRSASGGYESTDITQFYNLKANGWIDFPPIPIKINHPNTGGVFQYYDQLHSNSIYVLGGLATGSDGIQHAVANGFKLDAPRGEDQWTTVASIPKGSERGGAAVGVYNDLIVLAGGLRTFDISKGLGDTIASVVAYNLTQNKWVPLPSKAQNLPDARDHAGAAVVDGVFYVIGGSKNNVDNVQNTVFSLDLKNLANGWTNNKETLPTARSGLTAAAVNGVIYAFGGEGNTVGNTKGIFSAVEAFDTKSRKWTKLPPMPVPRHGSAAVTLATDRIYVPGGANAEGVHPTTANAVFYPS